LEKKSARNRKKDGELKKNKKQKKIGEGEE
jgi:hypothetical protein